MLQQKGPAKRPRKELPARSVLFGVGHGEASVPAGLADELGVPLCFAETAADAVECPAASYDGELEREPGEARVPWSWERAERVSEALVEKLSID
jgi:hypothetical protein